MAVMAVKVMGESGVDNDGDEGSENLDYNGAIFRDFSNLFE